MNSFLFAALTLFNKTLKLLRYNYIQQSENLRHDNFLPMHTPI